MLQIKILSDHLIAFETHFPTAELDEADPQTFVTFRQSDSLALFFLSLKKQIFTQLLLLPSLCMTQCYTTNAFE